MAGSARRGEGREASDESFQKDGDDEKGSKRAVELGRPGICIRRIPFCNIFTSWKARGGKETSENPRG